MIIKVFDTEKDNLPLIEKEVLKAFMKLNMVGTVETYYSKDTLAKFGIEETPAIVLNNKVKVSGKFPQKEDIVKSVKEEMEAN